MDPSALLDIPCSDEATGCIAAGMQGAVVATGKSFAVAQSVAAGGALPAVGYGAAGEIAGATAVAHRRFSNGLRDVVRIPGPICRICDLLQWRWLAGG